MGSQVEMQITRRHWLVLVPLAGLVPRIARARDPVSISVPSKAVGALVAAVGGDHVTQTLDQTLAAEVISIAGGDPLPVCARILLKGEGVVRSRWLDDARNATKTGSNIKALLATALPELAGTFEVNHRAWAKPFAKQALAWSKQLGMLRLGTMRDDHGRVYLLEWAGANIDPDGGASPTGLARAPLEPAAATLEAYRDYVADLIATLS